MCNDYEQHVKWQLYKEALEAMNLQLPAAQGPDDLPQADDIRIGDSGPVVRVAGNGVELVQMTFGFPPPRPKRPRVFNFVSEKRDFSNSKRCGIPASAFFEFTGTKYPKGKHRFSLSDEPFLYVAGLWREGDDGNSFTMLTTAPGDDIAPYHDRQVVVLAPADLPHWLFLSKPQEELLHPLSAGRLSHEMIRAEKG